MSNIKELRMELKTACELRNDILTDSYHPVIDRQHTHHYQANAAFLKLELHIQTLLDQIARLQRKTA